MHWKQAVHAFIEQGFPKAEIIASIGPCLDGNGKQRVKDYLAEIEQDQYGEPDFDWDNEVAQGR